MLKNQSPLFVVLLLGMVIGSCHPKPRRIPIGKEINPPIGAVEFCKRNPQVEQCKIKDLDRCTMITTLPPILECEVKQ